MLNEPNNCGGRFLPLFRKKEYLMYLKTLFGCGLAVIVAVGLAGCNKPASPPAADDHDHSDHDHDHGVVHAGHSLGGWWCDEHGVPEEKCALCNTKLVADFKAKSDWCGLHNRPDSQCFTCHPELEAEFAKLYEAKAGEKPPKPTDNGK